MLQRPLKEQLTSFGPNLEQVGAISVLAQRFLVVDTDQHWAVETVFGKLATCDDGVKLAQRDSEHDFFHELG